MYNINIDLLREKLKLKEGNKDQSVSVSNSIITYNFENKITLIIYYCEDASKKCIDDGMNKIQSEKERLQKINPKMKLECYFNSFDEISRENEMLLYENNILPNNMIYSHENENDVTTRTEKLQMSIVSILVGIMITISISMMENNKNIIGDENDE